MKTTHPIYLVTYTAAINGVSLGYFSVYAFGDSASEALTKFHRSMQHRKGYLPHQYRVTRLSELDRVHRRVIAHLDFPKGANPRIPLPEYDPEKNDPCESDAQTSFAF